VDDASPFLRELLAFGRCLRSLGLDVPIGRMLDATEALLHISLADRDEVRHALRALFVRRREDLEVFDRAFDAFWRVDASEAGPPGRSESGPHENDAVPSAAEALVPTGVEVLPGNAVTTETVRAWSAVETLAAKDFAAFTPEEVAVGRAALQLLVWQPGLRRTRRWVKGRGSRVDLRRAFARSVRTGGDLLTLPRLRRKTAPRRLVLLCDISGSMERYTRMLLYFAHALTRRDSRVEAFLFSTRLTRITPQLRARHIDAALANVAQSVPDWAGGTRIGSALQQLRQRWSRLVLGGRPVVLLISDGWDRGDPDELGQEMSRLRRKCRRLVWLNPLIGTQDYAPLTRGLQAALPFVDDFLPARNLINLADLAVHLNGLATARH
jgi:uncharacterized protein with von Willebrand factor type A (vWA) domain